MSRHEFTGDVPRIDFDRERIDIARLDERSRTALESGSLGAPGRNVPYHLPSEQTLLSSPLSHDSAAILTDNYHGESPFMPIGNYVVSQGGDIILALRRGTMATSDAKHVHSNDGGVTSANTMQIPPLSMTSLLTGLQVERVSINENPPRATRPDTWTQVQLDLMTDFKSLGMRGDELLATTTVLALGDYGIEPSDPRLGASTASIVSIQTGEKDHAFPVVSYPGNDLMMHGSEYGSFVVVVTDLDPGIELANESRKFSKIFRVPGDMAKDVLNKTADLDEMSDRIRLADGSELENPHEVMDICGGFCINGVRYVLEQNYSL